MRASGTFKLATAFKIFDVIHAITTTHEAITAITREVVEDFRADGVVYLELRTTPKVSEDIVAWGESVPTLFSPTPPSSPEPPRAWHDQEILRPGGDPGPPPEQRTGGPAGRVLSILPRHRRWRRAGGEGLRRGGYWTWLASAAAIHPCQTAAQHRSEGGARGSVADGQGIISFVLCSINVILHALLCLCCTR